MTPLRRGSNMPQVASFNSRVFLDAIRRAPTPLSRSEISHRTGLTLQTVTNISHRLARENLIRSAGISSGGRGKPRELLTLNNSGRYAIGLHLDPAVLTYVLLDLAGNVIAHHTHATNGDITPGELVDLTASHVPTLISSAHIPHEAVLGLGVAAPGPLDIHQGTILDPPHLRGWHNVPLRAHLAAATGLPITLDKDVTAAAVAERWAGSAADSSNFLFVYMGSGIGLGIVMNDIVVRGSSHNAGEFGHVISSPDAPPCQCGQRGCHHMSGGLGAACSPLHLAEQARTQGVLKHAESTFLSAQEQAAGGMDDPRNRMLALAHTTGAHPHTTDTLTSHNTHEEPPNPHADRPHDNTTHASNSATLTFHEALDCLATLFAEASRSPHSPAHSIATRASEDLARGIAHACNLLDPDLVVIGGPAWSPGEEFYLPKLRSMIAELSATADVHPISVVGTRIGDDVAAIGAGCLVLDALYAAQPDSLMVGACPH